MNPFRWLGRLFGHAFGDRRPRAPERREPPLPEVIVTGQVIDGQTLRVYYLVPGVLTLAGIETPELYGPSFRAGRAARDYLAHLLPEHTMLAARVVGKDCFGRELAEIYVDGHSANVAMLQSGHARPAP